MITIGFVGAGRATELHIYALQRVSNVKIRLKTIMVRSEEKGKKAIERFNIERYTLDVQDLLDDPEIDVVDICTPPYAHFDLVEKAIKAGKHIICEKPLHGLFEPNTLETLAGNNFMSTYYKLCSDIDRISELLTQSNSIFMYAENFIYAPAIMKAAEIISSKKSRILYAKGEESLKGSSSPVAGEWDKTGGGSLMRVGAHPLSAILYLKQLEAKSRNTKIDVCKISAEVGCVTKTLTEYEHRHIAAHPRDVEDLATVILKFNDESQACIISTDVLLGGSKNYVEIYCNDAAIDCKLTMNNAMKTYLLDEDGMEDVYLSEMLPSKIGWNYPFIADENLRGYVNEMQDFMECVEYGRQPRSGWKLASDTVKVIYASYISSVLDMALPFNEFGPDFETLHRRINLLGNKN